MASANRSPSHIVMIVYKKFNVKSEQSIQLIKLRTDVVVARDKPNKVKILSVCFTLQASVV